MRRKKRNTRIYLMLIFLFLGIGVVYGALTTSFSMSGTVKVASATYGITYSGSNVTFSPTSGSIIYGSTTTNKITPTTGYYLKAFSCTNGYTASATTGVSATAAQTITINNNKKVGASTCTATMSNSYTVTATGTGVTLGASSLGITYGKTVTVQVTPSTGYYLKSASCTNGYTVTNITTGVGNTAAQTLTINNNSKTANSTCTFTGSNSYTATMSGSNVTFSSNSLAITYGSTKTVTLTPSTGYYLSGITCTNGYTVTNATTGTSATGAQTITINNNSKAANSTCTATMAKRTFTATINGSNTTYSSTSLNISYGGTGTVTVTPKTGGYYLATATCTNGYTVTGGTYGKGNSTAQTLTINNNGNLQDTTCTITSIHMYNTTYTGSNVTFSSTTGALAYGGTTTVTLTPATGYYLSSISCTNGYTASATTGVSATAAQKVTITNPSVAKDSTCTATMANTYTATMTGSNVTFSSNSLAITYGSTKTVTLTPTTGYYLSSISCTNGYTVTATTGTGATAAQTITIKNNSNAKNSTCTANMVSTYTGPTEWEFSYLGSIQEFEVPVTGTYKLEVWGAQGGTSYREGTGSNQTGNSPGGKGGKSEGTVSLTKTNVLYIGVGGSGLDKSSAGTTKYGDASYPVYLIPGGYNGGGSALIEPAHKMFAGSGGGATHIAKGTNRGILANYENYKSEILIVAGGGGGGGSSSYNDHVTSSGGAGGGTTGESGKDNYANTCSTCGGGLIAKGGAGGTQTTGNAFGQGGNVPQAYWNLYTITLSSPGGGGGGYYGGKSDAGIQYTNNGVYTDSGSHGGVHGGGGGGGGSGYIGGVTEGTTTAGQREGDGYAKITLISIS